MHLLKEELNVLTIPQLAEYLQVGRNQAYALTKTPGFPYIQIGKQLRVPKTLLEEWITKKALDNTDNIPA